MVLIRKAEDLDIKHLTGYKVEKLATWRAQGARSEEVILGLVEYYHESRNARGHD